MKKEEFLEKLSEALRENMDNKSAYEHVSYYSNYIDNEKKKGLDEEEIIEKLGNPRLIAKSIIDSGNYSSGKSQYASYDDRTYSNNSTFSESGDGKIHLYYNGKSVNPLIAKIMVAVVGILVVALIFFILWGVAKFVFKVLIPIVALCILISFIVALISSFKKK